jgi:hypothetical protein
MGSTYSVQKAQPKGGCMDEVSATPELATVESGLTVAVPKSEVLAAVDGEGADLVLDVVRTNGAREERRVTLAWEPAALKQLADEADGDRVLIAIDPASLAVAFDDVEAHGLRETGATLAIAVTALGGAGTAAAEPFESMSGGSPVEATVVTSQWQDTGYGVRGTPSDITSQWQDTGYGVRGTPSDVAGASETARDLAPDRQDTVQASQTTRDLAPDQRDAVAAAETPDPSAAIENVRAGGTAVPDAVVVGDEGGSIPVPSAGVTAALAGGAALTIAAAVFALRRRREPRLA